MLTSAFARINLSNSRNACPFCYLCHVNKGFAP